MAMGHNIRRAKLPRKTSRANLVSVENTTERHQVMEKGEFASS